MIREWMSENNEVWMVSNGRQSVREKLMMNRWRWHGLVLRMSDQTMPKQALRQKPAGRRRVGRSNDTWQRTIQWDMTVKALNPEDVEARAGDRDAWRRFVANLWTT